MKKTARLACTAAAMLLAFGTATAAGTAETEQAEPAVTNQAQNQSQPKEETTSPHPTPAHTPHQAKLPMPKKNRNAIKQNPRIPRITQETSMKLRTLLVASSLFASFALPTAANALDVNIAADPPSVDVMHGGQKVTIQRNQDQKNTVNPDFAKTSRKCPPFCIQPGELAPGVESIGELEIMHYLKKMSEGDKSVIVVDSRTPDWVEKGTIPGAVNIPWDKLNIGKSDPITVQDILEKQFGVRNQDGFYMFDNAKTVVMFCNGPLRAIADQHQGPAENRLPGGQDQVVPGRHAGLGSAGADHGQAGGTRSEIRQLSPQKNGALRPVY